jgi:L-aspartate oxidase
VGGGMAGAWAASAAAEAGAKVILVDKGYCGTSGVTAAAGPGHWWVPPDPPEARATAVRNRIAAGLGLGESDGCIGSSTRPGGRCRGSPRITGLA